MTVFLIDSVLTMQESSDADLFYNTISYQLQKYAIEYILVKETNINKCKYKIDNDSLIILLNDRIDTITSKDNIYQFLDYAKQKNALIWPVALSKESRNPPNIINENQSFDVWEQLRCRNLSIEYLPVIATIFSRKIISRVMPTIYSEKGLIFVSHRRVDGEEITAKLCDQILNQAKNTNLFRDITEVQVGEEAQNIIDSAMAKSDIFIFIHTEQSSKSYWIQKELGYALLRNIPILWIQIDNADKSDLKIVPSENPNLSYNSSSFENPNELIKITDEILQCAFELEMQMSNKVFDLLDTFQTLFNRNMKEIKVENMFYSISVPRKNYHYPQRDIFQYIQLFGRTPVTQDIYNLKALTEKEEADFDSAIILTDRSIKREMNGKIVVDSFEDFYYHWNKYINTKTENKNMEIVISGAFPDSDEIYKQSLTDALIIFAKSIMKDGYTLTFGSHPTFCDLFFEIADEVYNNASNTMLKMYISKYFEGTYNPKKAYFLEHAQLMETEKKDTIHASLTCMRKEMIQRKNVSALICLGGRVKENKAEEGIREEIQLAQEYNIPVFIVGTVGGCSSEIALEFYKCAWSGLNHAPSALNKLFMESLDYFTLSQEMLSYLDAQKR